MRHFIIAAACLAVASSAVAEARFRAPTACVNVAVDGSAEAWLNPGNALTSDNARAATPQMAVGEFSDALVCSYAFNFPDGSHDCVFQVSVEGSNYQGYAHPKEIRIVRPAGGLSAGFQSSSGHWSSTDAASWYPPLTFSDFGEAAAACDSAQPTCGSGALNVNSPLLGVSLIAEMVPGSGAGNPRIDFEQLLIWCTPPNQ